MGVEVKGMESKGVESNEDFDKPNLEENEKTYLVVRKCNT